MKFAIFTAGINAGGQVAEKLAVEVTPGEIRRELLGIHADELGAQAAGDHLFRELARRNLPERKDRLKARAA